MRAGQCSDEGDTTLQQWIDHLWLVAPQRWALIAAVARCRRPRRRRSRRSRAATRPCRYSCVIVALAIGAAIRARLARRARRRGDRGVAVAREHRRRDDRLGDPDGTLPVRVPHQHRLDGRDADRRPSRSVDPASLARPKRPTWWSRRWRCGSIVYVLNERAAPGNAVVTFAGFVTLSVLVVLARVLSKTNGAPRGQLRGTSDHGTSRSTRMSPGRPSTRSPRMFFITSVVPPSIELARLRRKAFCGVSEPIAVSGRIIS